MKSVLVLGAGGFIGSHLVNKLKEEGNHVRGADLKYPEFQVTSADEFLLTDLTDQALCTNVFDRKFDEVYQLAADMGGAGYLFTGKNDAQIMHNSLQINLNVLHNCVKRNIKHIFYSSSACVYPEYNQMDPDNVNCAENTVYPAEPDSNYGWEKLTSERLYQAYSHNHGLQVHIARFHNIFGENGTYTGGKEKVPAALCRKIALASDGDTIEIWGDGKQTRSFLYIDECIEGILRLSRSDFEGPVNLGSERLISINDLAGLIQSIANKKLTLHHIDGPLGVRGRKSANKLIAEKLHWKPKENLEFGLQKTYRWIESQLLND